MGEAGPSKAAAAGVAQTRVLPFKGPAFPQPPHFSFGRRLRPDGRRPHPGLSARSG